MKKIAAIGIVLILSAVIVLKSCGGKKSGGKGDHIKKDSVTQYHPISKITQPIYDKQLIAGNPVDIEIQLSQQPADFDSLYVKADGKIIFSTNELKTNYNIQWKDSLQKVGYHVIESRIKFKNGKMENIPSRFFVLSDVTPVEYTYTIVNKFPHDENAYTQGLEISNGKLYEGTGQFGQSQLRQVDLSTGVVKNSVKLDDNYFGEGITVMGNKIYQLTWKNKTGFVYDKTTFNKLEEFTYITEGWGLANDGKHLILSDGTSLLYFLDPVSFKIVKTLDVWDNKSMQVLLNELEYIDGKIWANVYQSDIILQIDPVSGKVLGKADLTGIMKPEDTNAGAEVLNGIAYDTNGKRIFVTGKNWGKLYEITVKEKGI